jgi:filamentous hemagglutinin
MQRGIQAATAALQGLAGGNIGGALAGASAPELANIIGHHAGIDDDTAATAIAHAILGGVTAALQGNSAAAALWGRIRRTDCDSYCQNSSIRILTRRS